VAVANSDICLKETGENHKNLRQYNANIKFSKNQSLGSEVTIEDAQTHSDVTSLFTYSRNARRTTSSGSVRVQTKRRTPRRSYALPHSQVQLQYGLHETHMSIAPRGNLLIPEGHKSRRLVSVPPNICGFAS
jgi:hypothetical protein